MSKGLDIELAYPLRWPEGRPRTLGADRKRALWKHDGESITFTVARGRLRTQLATLTRVGQDLRTTNIVLSLNIRLTLAGTRDQNLSRREPEDPGVALYFALDRKPLVLACDRWDTVQDNIAAIAAHIEAPRTSRRCAGRSAGAWPIWPRRSPAMSRCRRPSNGGRCSAFARTHRPSSSKTPGALWPRPHILIATVAATPRWPASTSRATKEGRQPMACEHVELPGGGSAIVCGRRANRCACGNRATLLCDWKVAGKRSGTCDAPLCDGCTHQPAAEKDLCPAHAKAWRQRTSAGFKVGDVVPMPPRPAPRPAFTGAGAPSFKPSRSKKR